MNNGQPILEILIPTYRRPARAESAARSAVSPGNPNIKASIRSNGFEPSLDRLDLPRTRYSFFAENRGAIANFRELLRDSRADYVMLLSDEDGLAPELLDQFVQFLNKHKPSVALCDIVTSDGSSYFSLSALGVEVMSASSLARFWPLDPTYMSGTTVRRELFDDGLLDEIFSDRLENIYPHVLLRNRLAQCGVVGIFAHPLIRKGDEAKSGGDSHGHVAARSMPTQQAFLNPAIYGPLARLRQMAFHRNLLPLSTGRGGNALWLRIYLFFMWLRIVDRAAEVSNSAEPSRASVASAVEDTGFEGRLFQALVGVRPLGLRRLIINSAWTIILAAKVVAMTATFGPLATLKFSRRQRSS